MYVRQCRYLQIELKTNKVKCAPREQVTVAVTALDPLSEGITAKGAPGTGQITYQALAPE
jgi:hypothetical protein